MTDPTLGRPAAAAGPRPAPAASLAARILPMDDGTRRKRAVGLSKRVHGVFASVKNGCSIPWSSTGRRDLMSLLEVDAAAISYEAELERVRLVLDGVIREYAPAFRVVTHKGAVIVDVRLHREEGDGEHSAQIMPALRAVYAERGIQYRALSRRQIRLEPRFSNARWVLARRAYQPAAQDVRMVLSSLSQAGPTTLRALMAALPQVPEAASAVCAMAVTGRLALDLSASDPLDMAVRLGPGGARP